MFLTKITFVEGCERTALKQKKARRRAALLVLVVVIFYDVWFAFLVLCYVCLSAVCDKLKYGQQDAHVMKVKEEGVVSAVVRWL